MTSPLARARCAAVVAAVAFLPCAAPAAAAPATVPAAVPADGTPLPVWTTAVPEPSPSLTTPSYTSTPSPTATPGKADPTALDEQDEVAQWFRTRYQPALTVPVGFTGDARGCRPGGFSPDALAAMDKQVNAVRELVGLDAVPVRADATQQQSALMMEANETISHTPSSSWRCFSQGGAAAAGRSNLALGWPSQTAGSAVSQYLSDSDAYNTFVGHRRWLFHPSTPAFLVGQTAKANAWQVMGGTPRPDATTPATIAWPRAGWFPTQLEPEGRWSLTVNDINATFTQPSVRITKGGKALPAPRVYPAQPGFGMPTLVWQMPRGGAGDGDYEVTVTGVTRPGQAPTTVTYTTRLFTVR